MQSNIFLEMAPLLKEMKYNAQPVLTFLNQKYNHDDWIFPGVIARENKYDLKIIYEILEACVEKGLLKRYFDIYCPHCCRLTEERYESFVSIPNEIYCPHCDNEISSCYNKALIIYQVL